MKFFKSFDRFMTITNNSFIFIYLEYLEKLEKFKVGGDMLMI